MLDYDEALRDACELIDRLSGDCPLNLLNPNGDIALADQLKCEKCTDNSVACWKRYFREGLWRE